MGLRSECTRIPLGTFSDLCLAGLGHPDLRAVFLLLPHGQLPIVGWLQPRKNRQTGTAPRTLPADIYACWRKFGYNTRSFWRRFHAPNIFQAAPFSPFQRNPSIPPKVLPTPHNHQWLQWVASEKNEVLWHYRLFWTGRYLWDYGAQKTRPSDILPCLGAAPNRCKQLLDDWRQPQLRHSWSTASGHWPSIFQPRGKNHRPQAHLRNSTPARTRAPFVRKSSSTFLGISYLCHLNSHKHNHHVKGIFQRTNSSQWAC